MQKKKEEERKKKRKEKRISEMQHQTWFTGSLRLSLRVDTGTYIYVTITADGYQTPAGLEAHTRVFWRIGF